MFVIFHISSVHGIKNKEKDLFKWGFLKRLSSITILPVVRGIYKNVTLEKKKLLLSGLIAVLRISSRIQYF